MKQNQSTPIILLILLFTISCFTTLYAQNVEDSQNKTWRSKLYPDNWQPGFSDDEGRFFHDFSYAGYHSGLKDIPFITKNILDVTKPPYYADNTGKNDVTEILQQAINDLSKQGGGVLYLPSGMYKMSVSENKPTALQITSDNIVIRGDGSDKTFLKNITTTMREKYLIYFYKPKGSWKKPLGKEVLLSHDLLLPTTTIPVEDVSPFKKGDFVIIKTDLTKAFKEEHKVGSHWDEMNINDGVYFYREILAVDPVKKTLEIDTPTRYQMKARDNARVYKASPQLSECGIEDLSVGNIELDNPKGWGEDDYTIEGNGGYDAHASHLIQFTNVRNCWARNVHTFRPEENKTDIHVLSNGIRASVSTFVTFKDCNFQKSQYEGAGGNGYMFSLDGNDCLIIDCHAEHGRHNYDFKSMTCSGNVIYNCSSKDAYKATDFHMHLSMSNLIDSFLADDDCIDANFRPYGRAKAKHMYSTTQSVIWNTKGLKLHSKGMLIYSRQLGHGYVIGTSGLANNVVTTPVSGKMNGIEYDTSPEDWVEGVGKGETLYPQSLYKDQLKKRLARIQSTANK